MESGDAIPIEQRSDEELLICGERRIAPAEAHGLHIGFDVVPADLITAAVTEKGVLHETINADAVAALCDDSAVVRRLRDNCKSAGRSS